MEHSKNTKFLNTVGKWIKHERESISNIISNTMPLFSTVCITYVNKYDNKERCIIALYQGDKYEAQEYYLRYILKYINISDKEINDFVEELENIVISKYYSTMWKRYNVLVIAKECVRTEKLWDIEYTGHRAIIKDD